MQIQISWLLQKPTDLDLHCLLRQGMSCSAREGLIFQTGRRFFRIKCTFDDEMPVNLANSLRVYLASVLRSSLIFASACLVVLLILRPDFGSISRCSLLLWNCFAHLETVLYETYIISTYVHNFIINWFSTFEWFLMYARISIKFPWQFFIHILTQWSMSTQFWNKIALVCVQIRDKYIGIEPLKKYDDTLFFAIEGTVHKKKGQWHYLSLVLLNPDIPGLGKQCRSRSVGFWEANWSGSALFAIKYANL